MTKEKKLKILPYYSRFKRIFEKEKLRIAKAINGAKIYHIGSTAVPGLGGKGMIDIMIVAPDWKIARQYVALLKKLVTSIFTKKNRVEFLSVKTGKLNLVTFIFILLKKEAK